MALSKKLQEYNALGSMGSNYYMQDEDDRVEFCSELKKIISQTTEAKLSVEKLAENLYSFYDITLLNNQFINDLKEFAKKSTRTIFLVDWFNNETEGMMRKEKLQKRENKDPYFFVIPNPKFFVAKHAESNEDDEIVAFTIEKANTLSVIFDDMQPQLKTFNPNLGVSFIRPMNGFEKHEDIFGYDEEHDFIKTIQTTSYGTNELASMTPRTCFITYATFVKGYSIPLPEEDYPSRTVPECILTPSIPYDRHFTNTFLSIIFKYIEELPSLADREVVKVSKRYVNFMYDFFDRLKRTNKDRLILALRDITNLRQAVFNKEKETRELETLNKSISIKITKQLNKDIDLEKIKREFKDFHNRFESIDLNNPEKIIAITKEIEQTWGDGVYPRATYLLGKFEISIYFAGNVTIKNLTRKTNGFDHPHVNQGVPCLGTIARYLPSLILDGAFMSALDTLYGFLCSYAIGDGFQPFEPIHSWPKKAEIATGTTPTVVLQQHDPLEDDEPEEDEEELRQRVHEAVEELDEFENHPTNSAIRAADERIS